MQVSAVVATGKLQLVFCFIIYIISQSCNVNRRRLNDDILYKKIIAIGLDLLEFFEHITRVRNFLRHSVYMRVCFSSISVTSLEHELQEKLKGRTDSRVYFNKGL